MTATIFFPVGAILTFICCLLVVVLERIYDVVYDIAAKALPGFVDFGHHRNDDHPKQAKSKNEDFLAHQQNRDIGGDPRNTCGIQSEKESIPQQSKKRSASHLPPPS